MAKLNSHKHVAVLGAGILGSCTALYLARKGISVDLFDLESAPMRGASRWNEGKIHLGYLYGADTTLETARQLIPGGLAFAPLMQNLIDQSLGEHMTQADDVFLIHHDSVVGAEQAQYYYHRVSDLIRDSVGARDYLVDVRHASVRPVNPDNLQSIVNPDYARSGFYVPERSVQTNWVADQLCAALGARANIHYRMRTQVTGVTPVGAIAGPWRVLTPDQEQSYDYVVNALWHGRIDIDRSAGVAPPTEWSNRYRLSLFVRTRKTFDVSSAVLAVGPFGDIKNYNGRDFYLSWYPAGLVYEVENSSPDLHLSGKLLNVKDKVAMICSGLESAFRGIDSILESAETIEAGGGYVFAQGRGCLANPTSTLHRRDRFGVTRRGHYFSIDTGKYSIAPWLAQSLAREIGGD